MDPQPSGLRGANRLVAAGALALLVFMFFFDWSGESVQGTLPGTDLSGAGTSYTGWQTFTDSRWLWLATIVVALASVVTLARHWRTPDALQPGALVALFGAVSAVLILYRIVHHPAASAGFGGFHVSFGIRIGIWLGLGAALAIAGGGFLQLRAEGSPPVAPRGPEDVAFGGLLVSSGASGGVSPAAGPRERGSPAPSPPPAPGAPGDPAGGASQAPPRIDGRDRA